MTALTVDVTKRVGGFDLTARFAVESGIAVLFGPSGAGKSLTLSMIAGLTRPDTGQIRLNGRLVSDASAGLHVATQDRHVGMVFQDGLLLPHRTVLDNVALAVRQHGTRAHRRTEAMSWLEQVDASALAGRRPGSLSGGERQRVALARALSGTPAVLLLDEPISALDLAVRQELRTLIRELVSTSHVPTVLVTHDAVEAEMLGDVVVPCDVGHIVGVPPRATPPLEQRTGG